MVICQESGEFNRDSEYMVLRMHPKEIPITLDITSHVKIITVE